MASQEKALHERKMADPQLDAILDRRRLRSEGEESVHCYIKSPPRSPGHGPEDSVPSGGGDWYADEDQLDGRTPAPGDVGVTPMKSRTTALSTAAADIAAGSPHFSLETPPSSPGSSPRQKKAIDRTDRDDDKENNDEGAEDDVQYEWQFEIMNGLPHDKAVKLVNFLKKSERDRAQASAAVDNLQKEVCRLSSKEELDVPSVESEDRRVAAEHVPITKGRSSFWVWAIVGPVLLTILAGCVLHSISVGAVNQSNADGLQNITQSKSHSAQTDQVRVAATDSQADAAKSQTNSLTEEVKTATRSESLEAPVASTTVTATSSSVSQPPPPPPKRVLSAALYGKPALKLHHPAIAQDMAAQLDATSELGSALSLFPLIKRAVRLGRVVLDSSKRGKSRAVITCTVTLLNDGQLPWPAEAVLRLVMGPDVGLGLMTLGHLMHPGTPAELTLQFEIPYANQGKGMLRSGWILESKGEPFGPLLILESQVV